MNSGTCEHLAERTFQNAELQLETRLGTAHARLENELKANVTVEGKIGIFLVVVNARLEHPLMKEGAESVGFEIELWCDLVSSILLELKVIEADLFV